MNALDLGVLVVIALCALAGYRQGLIRTVYRLASFFIALFLSRSLYPHVARLLRNTRLFPAIQDRIAGGMNLEGFVTEQTVYRQAELIESLPLPAALRNLLHRHYAPDIHGVLQTATIEEHISGFFANMAINAIAIAGVFIFVMFALSIIGFALDIVGKLPVIRLFNRAGGLVVGLALGGLISFVALVVMTLLFSTGASPNMINLMQGSFAARWVLDSMLPQLTVVS